MKKILFVVLLMTPAWTFALDQDVEGCKDSPILNRMTGCYISECKPREFDTAEVAIGPYDWATSKEKTLTVEGKIDQITYECPVGTSQLAVIRNFESAFKAKGFNTIHSGDRRVYQDGRVLTLKKDGQYARVLAYDFNGTPYYEQLIVIPKEMKQELEVNADALEAEIKNNKRVAVYGIQFDIDKASIKPESEHVLNEIVTLLIRNPKWNMRIEGHTDATGNAAANMKLSQSRAAAVVLWLSNRGIAAARLTAQGLGSTKPLAPNNTDEGRQKNRRVELVKI